MVIEINDLSQNEYEASIESEELSDVAAAINKLSASSNYDAHAYYDDSSKENSIRKIVEENEDLKRQIIFLQQQVQEKEHRTRVLEKILMADTKMFRNSVKCRKSVNSATQVYLNLSDIS